MDNVQVQEKLEAISSELKSFIGRQSKARSEIESRLLGVEQRATAHGGGPSFGGEDSIGAQVLASDGFQMMTKGAKSTGQIRIGNFHKVVTLTNATQNTSQPLVGPYRVPGIVFPGQQRLVVRDLLPQYPANSNLITFAKESAYTNSAAPQTGEGNTKPQSDFTFTLSTAAVQTIAHWVAASRQLLEDAQQLEAYINGRLLYGLKLIEENQLLNGDGTGQNLSGLITNATTMDATVTLTASDTFIDVIRRGITQLQLNSNLAPDGIILNPRDWETIQLTKTTGTALNGTYIFSTPHEIGAENLWGYPVVITKSMPVSQFLIGNFSSAAAIWDRNDATVELSREHSDYFTRNLCALLCEERLALTVFRPTSLLFGGFPFGS